MGLIPVNQFPWYSRYYIIKLFLCDICCFILIPGVLLVESFYIGTTHTHTHTVHTVYMTKHNRITKTLMNI